MTVFQTMFHEDAPSQFVENPDKNHNGLTDVENALCFVWQTNHSGRY